MTILNTHGDFITLRPSEFNSYDTIRYSTNDQTSSVLLGVSRAVIVDFSLKLGSVSAEIDGSRGSDGIAGGSGMDSLWGKGGSDSLYGNAGDDLLVGDWDSGSATGNDLLFGGDGNDRLIGGTGNDAL